MSKRLQDKLARRKQMSKVSLEGRFFKDMEDAAHKLLLSVPSMQDGEDSVVIGVSEGGVFFADKMAQKLNAYFDILLAEPIYAPNNKELAIAMISETQEVVLHKRLIEAFDISEDFIYSQAQREYEDEVIGHIYRYRKGKSLLPLKEKRVILVDECIETGLTMMVALKSVIARGAKEIYIATPVLDDSVKESMLEVCDGVFCPYVINDYVSIEHYYEEFETMSFERIEQIIKKYNTKQENKEK